jgi:hypothetical protein
MNYDPTKKNAKGGRELLTGYLLKAAVGYISETPFKYGTVNARNFELTTAGLPLQHVLPTETIRTSRVDLPFASNDKIRLYDGRIMTVQNVGTETDDRRAQMGLPNIIGYIITLSGGGK